MDFERLYYLLKNEIVRQRDIYEDGGEIIHQGCFFISDYLLNYSEYLEKKEI